MLHKWLQENTTELVHRLRSEQYSLEGVAPGGDFIIAEYRQVSRLLDDLIAVLFPGFRGYGHALEHCRTRLESQVRDLAPFLAEQVQKVMEYEHQALGSDEKRDFRAAGEAVAARVLDNLPQTKEALNDDIVAAYKGDPAARSVMEVIMSYPCILAIATYRIAHLLYREDVPLIPRMMTELAHSRTGIDIHPGAQIGPGFFIDHGTGVVIGETCVIGRNVKLYQGVTLGAVSFPVDENGVPVKGVKRHPNVEDNVTIYSGATILGGETVIGEGSEIGGNVWLTRSVPPASKVYNQQPEPLIKPTGKRPAATA